jgi:hypothetical protein
VPHHLSGGIGSATGSAPVDLIGHPVNPSRRPWGLATDFGATMRIVRWAAAAVTVLMSLMNLPIAFGRGDDTIPAALAWAITALGVLGIAAAIGLILRARWGRPAVLAVSAVNAAGAVIALVTGGEGAVIGLTVSALSLVLGVLTSDTDTARLPASSPSLS